MKPVKMIASLAVAGALFTGAAGVGVGVASAAPDVSNGPVPTNRPHGGPGPWHDNGPGWNGWQGDGWGRGPVPGGWNGGWEPWGGVCLFGACI
jgi:hypothetical protein